jgi:hypothetical protein
MTLAEVPIIFGYRDRKDRFVGVEFSHCTAFELWTWRSHSRFDDGAIAAQMADVMARFTRDLRAALGGMN